MLGLVGLGPFYGCNHRTYEHLLAILHDWTTAVAGPPNFDEELSNG
jgi:hypothetical protein